MEKLSHKYESQTELLKYAKMEKTDLLEINYSLETKNEQLERKIGESKKREGTLNEKLCSRTAQKVNLENVIQ